MRPWPSPRRIARLWTKKACGTSTAGRIHALCFVSSASPNTMPVASAHPRPRVSCARQWT